MCRIEASTRIMFHCPSHSLPLQNCRNRNLRIAPVEIRSRTQCYLGNLEAGRWAEVESTRARNSWKENSPLTLLQEHAKAAHTLECCTVHKRAFITHVGHDKKIFNIIGTVT